MNLLKFRRGKKGMKKKLIILVVLIMAGLVASSNPKSHSINVGITFTKVSEHPDLKEKFRLCISSILKYATTNINFYIIGDVESQRLATKIFATANPYNISYQVIDLDADQLAKRMNKLVEKMQSHFSYSQTAYYGDALFFLSIGLHKVLIESKIDRIILLDSDLKFKADIAELYSLFDQFTPSNLIGIARDAQPVYRHLFWKYRQENAGTRVGDPPPNGLTGFNSGVLLLDLGKLRNSQLYDSLLNHETIDRLTEKYRFKGHLGDQDFFTLVGMEHEDMFFVLPCEWNRQLCRWWGEHGYADVFEDYYKCEREVKIYHGNCNTAIPRDHDEDEFEAYRLNAQKNEL